MNKCNNPVYKKVTRRGKLCDTCSTRSRGAMQECQTCTMTTCKKCYDTGRYDLDHNLSITKDLDWTMDVVDPAEPRRGPIVRHVDNKRSLSPQTRAKAVPKPKPKPMSMPMPKPMPKRNRPVHRDAHKPLQGHRDLYQTSSKPQEDAPVPSPESPPDVAEQQPPKKRKKNSKTKQDAPGLPLETLPSVGEQPVKKKPKKVDYQLYQTSKPERQTPKKPMDGHQALYQTVGEQPTRRSRFGEEDEYYQEAENPRTGYNHQAGYPPVAHHYPQPQNMVYDPRTGHYYPQQQENFAHNDGHLPGLRPLPVRPSAHYPTAPVQNEFASYGGPEEERRAEMRSERDYYSQQAYHHQMGYHHPSQPQNMVCDPSTGHYYPQEPQRLGYDHPQTGYHYPQEPQRLGYDHPQSGYHYPEQPQNVAHHDPRMHGLRPAHDPQSGRYTTTPHAEDDWGFPEHQQRRETHAEQNALVHGTPHVQHEREGQPQGGRASQASTHHGPTPESLVMNVIDLVQDDDDFPAVNARQKHRKSAKTQSDEDSLFVPEAESESESDNDSLFVPEHEEPHEVSVVQEPAELNQRAAEHEELVADVLESLRQIEQTNESQEAPQLARQASAESPQQPQGPVSIPAQTAEGTQAVVSSSERAQLAHSLEMTWVASPQLKRVKDDKGHLGGHLAALRMLDASITLGSFGMSDELKSIAHAWVDSLRRGFLTARR